MIGVEIWTNGEKYEGEWKGNKWHGYGKLTDSDGSFYIGAVKDGYRHGSGMKMYADGSVYKGDWANHKYEGHGTLTDKDGNVQRGEWRDGNLL